MISIYPESKALLMAGAQFSATLAGPMADAIAHLPADSLPTVGLRRYAIGERIRILAFYVRQFVAAWRRRRQALQTLRALRALSDRELNDLGLYRNELMSIAYNEDDDTRIRANRPL